MNTESFGLPLYPSQPTPYLLAEQLPIEQLEAQMQQTFTQAQQDPSLQSMHEAWAHVEMGLRQPDHAFAEFNFTEALRRTHPDRLVPEEFINTDTLVLRSFLPAFKARREAAEHNRPMSLSLGRRTRIFESLAHILHEHASDDAREIARASVLALQVCNTTSDGDAAPILYPASPRERNRLHGVQRYDHDAYTIVSRTALYGDVVAQERIKVPVTVQKLSRRESRQLSPEVLQLPYEELARNALKAQGIRRRRYPVHVIAELLSADDLTEQEEQAVDTLSKDVHRHITYHADWITARR